MPDNPYPINIPNPDPSDRSSAQVLREVSIVREILETRLHATEQAQAVSETRYLRIPEEVREAVKGLESLIMEKFKGIDSRFSERDVRVIQSDIDAKLALKAALDSAEKAVVKAEVGMTKLTDGLSKRIDELRDSEQRDKGSKQSAGESGKKLGDVIGHVVTLCALIVAIVALFLKVHTG